MSKWFAPFKTEEEYMRYQKWRKKLQFRLGEKMNEWALQTTFFLIEEKKKQQNKTQGNKDD